MASGTCKLGSYIVGVSLAALAGTGCQGNGNFPTELSNTTPLALQVIRGFSQRLGTALQTPALPAAATTALQSARSLIDIPQQFLVAFSTKATTISRTQGDFSLVYTSDDVFTPQANWQVTVSGGRFGSTPQAMMVGHVTSDGSAGDYQFNLAGLGDSYKLEWSSPGGGTVSIKLSAANQQPVTILLQSDNHGSISTIGSSNSF